MAQPSIPISQVVKVNPSVVNAGGNPLSLNAIFITDDGKVPSSSVLEFASRDDVAAYFGSGSALTTLAGKYFNGWDGSFKKPGVLYFARYSETAVAGFLRGVTIDLLLTELQAITGTLSIYVDGVQFQTSTPLNLSAVGSFSAAAAEIQTALSLGAAGTVTWDSLGAQFVVTSATTGAASSVSLATGTAAAALGLDAGITSSGADADTPATGMDRIKAQTQNSATFMLTFDTTDAQKEAFAAWNNDQADRYAFVFWDDANGYKVANNASTFGAIVERQKYEGAMVVYDSPEIAASVCGYAASIDWEAFNGRATPAFKSFSGLTPSVDSLAVANAVLSNNASYYGYYGAPGDNYDSCLYNGQMQGSKFLWLDTYINQIRLNTRLQLAIWNGLRSVNAAPYNARGETLLRAWCADPIAEALNNGSIQTGVALSESQKATIASQAGLDISNELFSKGYYLQILPATAQVRQARQSPPVKLWYMDGGSIQSVSLASIAVL